MTTEHRIAVLVHAAADAAELQTVAESLCAAAGAALAGGATVLAERLLGQASCILELRLGPSTRERPS